jgi:DNA polymerase-3 subunit delta
MVLAMVTRHFRQLWRVKELCEKKVPVQDISRATGINPYFIKGIVEQAGNYRLSEFRGIFERLFATDLALKTSGGKPVSLMECLVMDICGNGAERRGG